jgi:predicted methyltransferase
MKSSFLFSILIVALAGCSSSPKPVEAPAFTAPTTIEEAVSADYRSPEMRQRDSYRHPVETLKFFGVEPQMTVIEISPAKGWYTQILAPYLNASGQYVAAEAPSDSNEHIKQMNDARAAWLSTHQSLVTKAQVVTFDPSSKSLGTDDSADMVLTFRNVHNWMSSKGEAAAFKSFFNVLKPGGTLGVVEHRANPKSKKDSKGKSGYVREKDVIAMAKKAGFKLVEKSEINANPKDTKNYAEGVWTLPPVLKLKEKDQEKYMAIGESDRMTLKFIKPVKK